MAVNKRVQSQVCRGCGNERLTRVGSKITCPSCGNTWNATPWRAQIDAEVKFVMRRKEARRGSR